MAATVRLGLQQICDLATHLPTYTRPTCHIAGTNGKGSVSGILSSIFLESGFAVGRYNSPHLVDIYDSIVIDGEPVSAEIYNKTRGQVEEVDKVHQCGASSFELLTMTALMIFEKAQIDVVILEVGMGGRLDATNFLPDSVMLVSALTSVDLDHQAFLGSTIEGISKEKAAIARKDVPFILGAQRHQNVEPVVTDVVGQAGALLLKAERVEKREWSTRVDGPKWNLSELLSGEKGGSILQPVSINVPPFSERLDVSLPLLGEHQLDNLGVAVSIISALLTTSPRFDLPFNTRITTETLCRGIKHARWPGRLSFHSIQSSSEGAPLHILVDGAHNQASSAALAAYISSALATLPSGSNLSLTYVLALSHSPPKTPLDTLTPLLPPKSPQGLSIHTRVACVQFTPPAGMPWVRPEPTDVLSSCIKELLPNLQSDDLLEDRTDDGLAGLARALEWAGKGASATVDGRQPLHLVILAGSLYLVADFYRLQRDVESSS